MAQRAHSRPSTSGRGRHRKPTNHTRKLGLATAPIVAAIPMATASPSAAASSSWDRLAQCESGGNWSINTGNGYYGGLQFADGTWDGYGGEKFASRADMATRVEQIIVAARLLDNSGWGPWPACSSKLGLGASERREALATAEEYRARYNGQQAGTAQAGESKQGGGQAGSGNGDAKPADGNGDGQAAGDAKAADGGNGNGDGQAAGDAQRNGDAQVAERDQRAKSDERPAAEQRAAETRVSTERASRSKARSGKHRKARTGIYVVRPGDTLSAIARNRDVPGGWQNLYKINRKTIGGNPGLIYPGQRLSLR
jgi:LysM repeat protein